MKLIVAGNSIFVREQLPHHNDLIDGWTKFRPHNSEGHIHLYHPRFHQLPIGMLSGMEYNLLLDDLPYQIVDKRVYRDFRTIRFRYLNDPPLRPYQIEALRACLNHKRGIVSLPTGTGKTRLAEALMAALRLPTVFYVDRERLLKQTLKEFKRMFKTTIGQVGAGEINIKKITVAMVQTATNLPERLFTDFGLSIMDECHHTAADTYFDIAQKSRSEYMIGLSATPYREDGMDMLLEAGIGPIIYRKTLSEMIEKGYLARPYIKILLPSQVESLPNDKYWEVLLRAVIHNPERNKLIATTAIEECIVGKTYIHVDRLDHGPQIVKAINRIARGDPQFKAKWLCGNHKVEEKDKLMEQFIEGKLRILVSTLLGEGIDVPQMYCLINATGGGKGTKVNVPQLMGRLLRPSEHEIVIYYDIFDQAKFLEKHFAIRSEYYQSQRAFVLDEFVRNFKGND